MIEINRLQHYASHSPLWQKSGMHSSMSGIPVVENISVLYLAKYTVKSLEKAKLTGLETFWRDLVAFQQSYFAFQAIDRAVLDHCLRHIVCLLDRVRAEHRDHTTFGVQLCTRNRKPIPDPLKRLESSGVVNFTACKLRPHSGHPTCCKRSS